MVSNNVLRALAPELARWDNRPGIPSHVEVATEPAAEPVSVDQFRRIAGEDEVDATTRNITTNAGLDEHAILPLIRTARRVIERYLGQAFITQTVDAYFDPDQFNDRLRLLNPPLQSITSIISTDDSGTETTQTASTYYALTGRRCEVVLHDGQTWPSSPRAHDAMVVKFVAGYGASAIGTPNFQANATPANGTGIRILATGGTYCGTEDITYRVMCDGATTFKYSTDAGLKWRKATTTMSGAYQLLDSGVFVKFPAVTGYTAADDYWDITCTGHGVPEQYCLAIASLAFHLRESGSGYARDDVSDIVERGKLPPVIAAILGPRVLV